MIRPFGWRDFPRLHQYRKQGIWLNNDLALTQWQIQVPFGALFAYMAPAVGVYTYVISGDESSARQNGRKEDARPPLIGQVSHRVGTTFARINFVAPEDALDESAVPFFLDQLAADCGRWGAHTLLAEVEERSPLFEIFRRGGYGIFSRQQVWLLPEEWPSSLLQQYSPASSTLRWRPVVDEDEGAVRSLYSAIVPPLVQQTDPPWERLSGYLYSEGTDLLAYVHLSTGPRGILAQPYVHPDVGAFAGLLADLFKFFPYRGDRPIYVLVRSYQGWLNHVMSTLGATSGPQQAVMAKRLVLTQKMGLSIKLNSTGGPC